MKATSLRVVWKSGLTATSCGPVRNTLQTDVMNKEQHLKSFPFSRHINVVYILVTYHPFSSRGSPPILRRELQLGSRASQLVAKSLQAGSGQKALASFSLVNFFIFLLFIFFLQKSFVYPIEKLLKIQMLSFLVYSQKLSRTEYKA